MEPDTFGPLRYETWRVARRLLKHPHETMHSWAALARRFRSPGQVLRMHSYRGPPRVAALDLLDGHRLHVRAGTDDRWALQEVLMQDLYEIEGLQGTSLDTVVDVGAHAGLFMLLVAPLARRVVCLEPEPANRAMLELNVELNGLTNVRVLPWAVGAGDGALRLRFDPEHNTCHSAFAGGDGSAVDVPSRSLETLLRDEGIDRVDLLKIDCEGGEHDFLGCASDATLARVARIRFESHEWPGAVPAWTTRALTERLQGAGFRVWKPKGQPAESSVSMLFAEQAGRRRV